MKKRNIAIAIGGAVGAAVAVKLLTRPATVTWEEASPFVAHAERSKFIHVDGVKMHYQEFGSHSAPTILLIHGYTASANVWKTVAPMLAENGFHVIAPDLVGFGYTEKPRWFDYSIQTQARMLARLLVRLGVGRCVVIGSSYGGAVAMELTLDNDEKVEKLVLVDTVINDGIKRHPILRLASVPGLGEAITPFLCDSKALTRLRMNGSLAAANRSMVTDERVASAVRPLAAADAHHSVLATARNWNAARFERDAQLLTQPTLIIWGDSDTIIPASNGHKLHQEMLNSRFVILKDCGHMPQEEKSGLFAALVTEFCNDKKGHIAEPSGGAADLIA